METKVDPSKVISLTHHRDRYVEDVCSRPIETGVGDMVLEPAYYTATTFDGDITISRKQFKKLSKQFKKISKSLR
jgi:hypothetical protein